jgi:hypothetical protein
MQYALALASKEGNEPMATKPGTRAEDEKPEDEKKDKPEAAEPPPPPAKEDEPPKSEGEPNKEPDGDEKPAACEKCGEEGNPADARYCKTCGEKVPGEVEEDKPEPGAEPPPDDKDKETKPESRAAATSYAGLLGLSPTATHPAIKTAIIAHVSASRKAMALTATDSPAAAIGALQAMADEAAKVPAMAEQIKASAKREEWRTRNDLLTKLANANLPGCSRGDLFVDKIDAKGERSVVPARAYAEMNIDTLKGLVDGKLKGTPSASRSPYEPADKSTVKTAQKQVLVDEAATSSFVEEISSVSTASKDQLARTLVALQAQGEHQS